MSLALDILRSIRKEQIEAGTYYKVAKTTCRHGHPRTPENTYYHRTAGGACKICRAEHMKAYYRRRKAKKVAA